MSIDKNSEINPMNYNQPVLIGSISDQPGILIYHYPF